MVYSPPFDQKMFNKVEIFSNQIGNIIFLLDLCFTDFVYLNQTKEVIGRVIIGILGFYIGIMLVLIIKFGFFSLKKKVSQVYITFSKYLKKPKQFEKNDQNQITPDLKGKYQNQSANNLSANSFKLVNPKKTYDQNRIRNGSVDIIMAYNQLKQRKKLRTLDQAITQYLTIHHPKFLKGLQNKKIITGQNLQFADVVQNQIKDQSERNQGNNQKFPFKQNFQVPLQLSQIKQPKVNLFFGSNRKSKLNFIDDNVTMKDLQIQDSTNNIFKQNSNQSPKQQMSLQDSNLGIKKQEEQNNKNFSNVYQETPSMNEILASPYIHHIEKENSNTYLDTFRKQKLKFNKEINQIENIQTQEINQLNQNMYKIQETQKIDQLENIKSEFDKQIQQLQQRIKNTAEMQRRRRKYAL